MQKPSTLGALCSFALALLPTSSASAQDSDVAAFYKGRQINVYIGAAVGGGYDAYARLVARHIGAYIPGNPSVVPVNMVGAGGAVAIVHIQSVAPRDGTSIVALQPGTITAPLFTSDNRYDSRTLVYIGNANSEVQGCWSRSDAPVKSYNDLFSKELILGATTRGDGSYDLPIAQNYLVGTRFKLVSGYTGVNEILLAMDKNEVHGICGTGVPAMMAQKPDWVTGGFIKMLVQENVDGSQALNQKGIPRSPDFAKSDEDRKALALIYGPQKFGRPFAIAAGAPPERVAALRHAFLQALEDKQMQAEAANLHLDLKPMSGEDLQKMVVDIFNTPPEIVERAKQAVNSKMGL